MGYMNSGLVSNTNLATGEKTIAVSNFETEYLNCQTNVKTFD